ncbi:hypothetical protein [Pseudomonas fluorescens]|uniref:DUF1145 domain-containing protein n=1 Tax=Pseudomonas fluorescens TaxID=294 RepID=A0A5E7ATN5_PSEFL|nr:hypothetical protein [Pseudomonas fluorescens]VVN82029.1 hypothetical protein PS691_01163 [Pseudomonas fluorescens]
MTALLKFLCLGVYVLGAASTAGLLPDAWSFWKTIAAVLLAAHVLEAIAMFKYVKRYPGSLGTSLVLTLLFGILHCKPLMQAKVRP